MGVESDPLLIPKLTKIDDCTTKYWNETQDIKSTCVDNYTLTEECDKETKGSYLVTKNNTYYCDITYYYNYTCKTGIQIIQFNKTDCKRPTYDYLGKTVVNEWNCDLNDLICDSCNDGNCDGIVQSGESYVNLKTGVQRLDDNYKVWQ